MDDVMHIQATRQTIESLKGLLNDKGVMEIVIRGKKKRIEKFQKVVFDALPQGESVEKLNEAINLMNKNLRISDKSLKLLGSIAKLNKFNLVISGVNLCATCIGFAIMYKKLDKMSGQISEMICLYKKGTGINVDYEFKKIISEHSNMLDCRRKQSNYTEEKMRELVDDEFNVLGLLIDVFLADISNNRGELLFSILSLAQMLSASMNYFDEIYYFNNRSRIANGDPWHMSHDNWIAVFDRLTSIEFIKTIQDYGTFDMGLNTRETDCFYIDFYDQIKGLKQDIEDNQALILALDDIELLKSTMDLSAAEARQTIESAFREAGITSDAYGDIIRAATA